MSEYKLSKRLGSMGVKIDKEQNPEIEKILLQKSVKRYEDILKSYKNRFSCQTMSWERINSIYKNDIKIRRKLNIHISRLEILLRSHIMNVFIDENATIYKSNNQFSKKYFVDNSTNIKSYIDAKKSFRWRKRENVTLNMFMEESSFGIIIEVYRFLKPEYLNIHTPYIKQTKANYDSMKTIKDKLRNPIAHLAILYERITLDEMKEYLGYLSSLCNISTEENETILNLINEIYKI